MIVGIAPGVVNTGCVGMRIDPDHRDIRITHTVVQGLNVAAIAAWTKRQSPDLVVVGSVRRPEELWAGLPDAGCAQTELKKALPNAVLMRNTGIKKIVTPKLLLVLGLDKFSTPTHHDDLVSAARIMVARALKDDWYNSLIAGAVRAHLDGNEYQIVKKGLGVYPHGAVAPISRPTGKGRMVKMQCEVCGFITYTTRKWIDAYIEWPCPCGAGVVAEAW